jgi:hypothetical protein
MVVKVYGGMRIHSPPTPRRSKTSSTSVSAVGRLLSPAQLMPISRRPQNSSSRRRQNRTALERLLEPVDPALPLADNPARVLDVPVRPRRTSLTTSDRGPMSQCPRNLAVPKTNNHPTAISTRFPVAGSRYNAA